MNDFLKCECPHCGQSIEYPAEGTGQTVPCPTCEKPVALTPVNPPTPFNSIVIPPPPATVAPTPAQKPEEKKSVRTILSKLTEETIRATTQTRDTPLHRAAKTGRISEIPKHLLKTELFMARNNSFSRETPLHLAAQYGHLDKIPREFLTKETLTASTEYEKKESKTGLTPPRTETPLHTAIRYGHADQIPKEFLTPEFLSIEASGYRLTVLHQLAYANRLDLVPDIYANSEMWNLRNSSGQTPRDVVETNIKQEAYIARVRNEPATEKQKEKLRYFGYVFDEKISKGQASDALDKCAKDFPEVNQAYYNRPATEEQLAYILPILEADGEALEDYADEGKSLTYQQAKDLIWDYKMRDRKEERLKELTYWESDDGRIDQAWARIDAFREVAREQVAKAWAVVKSRMTDKSQQPDLTEVEHTMEELFPELRKNPDYKALEANYIYTKQLLQQKLPTEDNLKMLAAVEGGLKKIKQKLQQSRQTEEQLQKIKEMELKLDQKAGITASKLDELLKLEGQPPRAEDLALFARHGITLYTGDAFSIYAAADLARCFENMFAESGGYTNVSMASVAASDDPAIKKATITLDQSGQLVFTWPKRKLEQWYRKGAKY